MKTATYRGREFNILKETKTHIFLENYDKTPRKVLKDEVIIHFSKKETPSFNKPTIKETEILEPKEEKLPTSTQPKDLQEKLESGSYIAEISAPYPDGNGNTTYRVFFDIYGQHLEETSIERIDDVDTGEKNIDMTTLNLNEIEKLLNIAIQKGEIIPNTPEPEYAQNDLDEMTIKNTGQELDAKKDIVDDLPDQKTLQPAPYVPGKSHAPSLNSIKYVDESLTKTELSKNHNMPGINVSTETPTERMQLNKDRISQAIAMEFKEEIQKMLKEIENISSTQPNKEIVTELDSGKELKIIYEIVKDDKLSQRINIFKIIDTLTGNEIEHNSLPFHEKEEIQGAIKAQEDIDF